MSRLLIAGCGDVGIALGSRLAAHGHAVFGLRRSAGRLPPEISGVSADVTRPETLASLPSDIEVLVYAAAPDHRDETAYHKVYVDGMHHVLEALRQAEAPLKRVFFVSSTSVYAQSNGEWVDESSETAPHHFTGKVLLEAESLLESKSFSGTAVRFGGIYGPGRTRLLERVRSGAADYRGDRTLYTNRIHRDDAAGALAHLIALPDSERLYLGVDCDPAPEAEVLTWIAERLRVSPPKPRQEMEKSPEDRGGNKRCSNRKLLASGYIFQYPTFREGYGALITSIK